ncbi:MAG: hypothetical protein GXP33_00845 [Spirochaetes bacterium]|nr:hypothetical protein [Spirochaetota bacterium]
MNKFLIKTLFLISLIVIVSSCGDNALFAPLQDNSSGIQVKTITDGELINPDTPVSFQIIDTAADSKDLSLEITLEDSDSKVISYSTLDSPGTNQDIPLELPQLADGQYTLRFKVTGDGETISEKTVSFFYVTGSYKILGIQSDPPVIGPDTEVKLQADLNLPDNADPYLRWSQNGKVIGSGTLSKGAGSIEWKTPEEEGVYSIKVELFPFPPPAADDYSFSSSIYLNSEVYVTRGTAQTSFYSSIYFNESPEEYGMVKKLALSSVSGDFIITPIGTPAFTGSSPKGGFKLTNGAGFTANYSILPFENGTIQPFTITIDLSVSDSVKDRTIVSLTDEGGFPYFKIRFNTDSEIEAVFRTSGKGTVTIPSGIKTLPPEQETRLSLSVFPSENSSSVSWFLNGFQVSAEKTQIDYDTLQPERATVIGGNNGFTGIIYSLNVFFKDKNGNLTTNPGILHDELNNVYDRNLIFADGFDGQYPADDITLKGRWELNPGFLILKPSSEIKTIPVQLSSGKFLFSIALNSSVKDKNSDKDTGTGTIILIDAGTGTELLKLLTDGTVVSPEAEQAETAITEKNNIIRFTLVSGNSDSGLFLTAVDKNGKTSNIVLSKQTKDGNSIILKIINTKETDLSLDYLTIIKAEK